MRKWRLRAFVLFSLAQTQDVDVNDGSHLFKLLDDGDGNLTYEEHLADREEV